MLRSGDGLHLSLWLPSTRTCGCRRASLERLALTKYLLAANGNREYSLYPIAGGEPQKMNFEVAPDEFVMGFFDGGKNVLLRTRTLPAKITRVDLATDRRQPFKEIAPADPAGAQSIPSMRFSADGKSYAYALGRFLSDLYVVDGLK